VLRDEAVVVDVRAKVMRKPWVKWLLVTVLGATLAFMLASVLFPPAEGAPKPTAGQMPFFLFLSLTDTVLLGLGAHSWSSGCPC
jgi:hypothetical protein